MSWTTNVLNLDRSQFLNSPLKLEEDDIANEFFTKMAQMVQSDFSRYRSSHYAFHIEKTRHLITQGAENLTKKSRVIVLGPGEIEPLNKLTKMFNEVALVDYVQESIEELSSGLGKKVRTIKFDLSRGLVDQAKNFIVHTRERNLEKSLFVQEACLFLTSLNPNGLPLEHVLGSADYVVSSFIITQLANQVTLYIEQRLEKLYGPLDPQKDVELMDILSRAEAIFRRQVHEQHILDLKSLLTPEGCIYLADAVEGKRVSQRLINEDSTVFQMLEPGLLEKIPSYFDKVESFSWDWESTPEGSFVEDPNMKVVFKVRAYFLHKDLAEESLSLNKSSKDHNWKWLIGGLSVIFLAFLAKNYFLKKNY